MRCACPSCGTVYNIPDDKVGGTARCTKCSVVFPLEPLRSLASPPAIPLAPRPAWSTGSFVRPGGGQLRRSRRGLLIASIAGGGAAVVALILAGARSPGATGRYTVHAERTVEAGR